jgi:hypothetical protein
VPVSLSNCPLDGEALRTSVLSFLGLGLEGTANRSHATGLARPVTILIDYARDMRFVISEATSLCGRSKSTVDAKGIRETLIGGAG